MEGGCEGLDFDISESMPCGPPHSDRIEPLGLQLATLY